MMPVTSAVFMLLAAGLCTSVPPPDTTDMLQSNKVNDPAISSESCITSAEPLLMDMSELEGSEDPTITTAVYTPAIATDVSTTLAHAEKSAFSQFCITKISSSGKQDKKCLKQDKCSATSDPF
ncbi:hypothetical protein LTR78_009452 [Recurvomyces mirabilis]|uniref:Secreted protein n=1 Tax=Recurvomyces mirabilis TaxID=574656 RepID=A0AAE0TRP0_9PEZI|nr:hypothetical protein LTR78_009452 [Recurvomyces mirabilis]KAK5152357.1 hypothetical protein LTS14_008304 [Recurvomyces mirabilis]